MSASHSEPVRDLSSTLCANRGSQFLQGFSGPNAFAGPAVGDRVPSRKNPIRKRGSLFASSNTVSTSTCNAILSQPGPVGTGSAIATQTSNSKTWQCTGSACVAASRCRSPCLKLRPTTLAPATSHRHASGLQLPNQCRGHPMLLRLWPLIGSHRQGGKMLLESHYGWKRGAWLLGRRPDSLRRR